MTLDIELCGERIELRADRSLYWPARRTLVIADPHFGKADTFRAAGLPIPGGPSNNLMRLDAALQDTSASRLIILGDFWHAPQGRTDALLTELAEWRATRPDLQIELIRGNHDYGARIPHNWTATWHTAIHEAPFVFTHVPEPSNGGFVLAGHIHPGVILEGRARERFKLPCFWFHDHVGILPAFGSFTGLKLQGPNVGRCFAIVENTIVEVSR